MTCRVRRPEWAEQAELYTSKEANEGMVDLSGKPGALGPCIITECELHRGKWTKEGQGPRLGGMQEAQGQLTVCLDGNTVLRITSIMSVGLFLLVFLQPTFLQCLLPGIT